MTIPRKTIAFEHCITENVDVRALVTECDTRVFNTIWTSSQGNIPKCLSEIQVEVHRNRHYRNVSDAPHQTSYNFSRVDYQIVKVRERTIPICSLTLSGRKDLLLSTFEVSLYD